MHKIDIESYNLVDIDDVQYVKSDNFETLYDITVDETNDFFVRCKDNKYLLMHNCDGSHVASMILGLFKRFAPNLFKEGRICRLMTPLIISKDSKGKIVNYFFNVTDFKKWESENKNNKLKHIYLKGLGSWERDDLITLIDKFGFEHFVLEYNLDEDGETYIEDWLGNDAEKRKNHLRQYSFDINKA